MSVPVVRLNDSETTGTPTISQPTREWLLERLGQVLEIAMERVTNTKTSAAHRMKWSRIVIASGQACNSILRDAEIETLKQQVKELKELATVKLSDEQADDQDGDSETQTND